LAEIVMPQLGETVTEGTITRWMKKVGDPVLQDEVLFEVSTDKVDSEVPSSASGFLTQILVQEGETVDVGTAIAVVESEAGATPPAPVAATPPPQPVAETPASSADALLLSPVVRKLINENGLDSADIDGTGAGGRGTRSDLL
jgi:2-oxoglutarate dehydrogenase E2 component (dihydrolipoamide succinyltransferase)